MPEGTYQILDLGVTLASRDEAFLAAFHEEYGRFEARGPLRGRPFPIHYDPGFLDLDGERRSLEGHPFPGPYALFVLHRALMDAVGGYTVLHGAVLAHEDRALVLSGPSGTGKTTLALDLLEEGLAFLSDDFCPVSRATGWVHPFPRSLWVRDATGAGATRALPAPHQGKRRLAAEGPAFRIQDGPCPMGWLICLDPGPGGEDLEVLQVGLRPQGRDAFLEAAGSLPGVAITKPGGPESHEWQLRYPREAGLAPRLAELLEEHRETVWNTSRVPAKGPDFDREPTLMRIPPHEAAFLMLRERKQGSLPSRTKAGGMLMHLNEILAEVGCYRLTPGHRKARKELVRGLLRGEP